MTSNPQSPETGHSYPATAPGQIHDLSGHHDPAVDPYGGQQHYGQPSPYADGQYGHPAGQFAGQASGLPHGPYASWGQRVGAYLLDMVWALPGLLISMIGLILLVAGSAKSTSVQDPYAPTDAGTTDSGGGGMVLAGFALMFVGWIISLVAAYLNRWRKGGLGASWGKQKMGLRLVEEQTGRPIGTGGAFVRDLVHVVDGLPLDIGFLWPLWDEKRQTFADKICRTTVVQAQPQQHTQPGYGSHV